jgi:two-component sensor histidine kinase
MTMAPQWQVNGRASKRSLEARCEFDQRHARDAWRWWRCASMLGFLEGDGRMAAAIQAHDWSQNPIGPPATWPSVLKTTVGLILSSQFPQCIVWGPSLITIYNDAFVPILGDKPDALGTPFNAIWSEVWPSLQSMVEQAFAGEATYIEDFPLVIDRRGYAEQTHFTFCYSPIRDEFGQIGGMLDTVTETTIKVEQHERQKTLSRELGHRLKNLLSVIQAVASQTLRQSSDLKTANEALGFRLAALGRASDVLTATDWHDAELHMLVRAALATHESVADRFSMTGPPVRFRSEAALGLALAFHELATNATKYGALSNDQGRVEISWSIEGSNAGAKRLRLEWREVGGPKVDPPARRGFGSLMIERSLRGYLRAEVDVSYHADGLVLEVTAPLLDIEAGGNVA